MEQHDDWEERPDMYGTMRARPTMRPEDIVVEGDGAGPLVTEEYLFSQGAVDIGPDPWSEEGTPGLRFTPV